MARISKYNNDRTEASNAKAEDLIQKSQNISLEIIEKFQLDNGISDSYMASLLAMDKSQLSKVKAGKSPLTNSHKTIMALVLEYFKL